MKKNPFGVDGDFITSPLISNLFGEMIAVWCVAYWEYLGKPKKILIVELGPGEGSLCNNLLKTFKKFKDFYNCLEINLLEISDKLKKIQNSKIKNSKVKWINSINNINYGPIIFLGNEFFDSLPIKQIYKKGNLLFEKHVALSNNKGNLRFLYKKISKKLIQYNNIIDLSSSKNMIEYPIEAIEYLKIISKKIHKFNGCLLAFDYGYVLDKNQNTLQSVMKHRYKNIFSQVGNSDITSLVNFALFEKILRKNNLNVKRVVTQSEFLQKMGILERANILSKKIFALSKIPIFRKSKYFI